MEARPRGREEIRAAVVSAARRRFAAEGLSASMRDIAGDAGVNLGLLHRHFGTKEALVGSVLRDVAAMADADFATARSVDGMLKVLVEGASMHTEELETYVRILAWILLSGQDPARFQGEFPAVSRLLRDGGPARRGDVLLTLVVAFGWGIFSGYLADRLGYSSEAEASADLIEALTTVE